MTFFASTIRVNFSVFFKVTGILIMLIAAGLFSTAIHEFQEAGVIPVIKNNIYDISNILSRDSIIGGVLRSLFGYSPSPSLLETVGYLMYIVLIVLLIGRYYFKRFENRVEKSSYSPK